MGERVIVGEEIMTLDGEIIGLFLKQRIAPHLSAEETINQIKLQGGLVYIPHPLEHIRRGLKIETLNRILSQIDIIEVFNARTKERWLSKKVEQFASEHGLAQASSSDAHGIRGFGSAYSVLTQSLNKETLVSGLKLAKLIKKPAPFFSQLNPLTNKLKKKLKL